MTIMQSQFDPNKQTATGPTAFMTERNEHEVRCGMCARPVYVDEDTYNFVAQAVASGLDYPFRCEICEAEYDDLAYEG